MKLDNIKQFKPNKEQVTKLFYKLFKILIYVLIFILLIFIYINEMKSIKTFNYETFIIVSESMEPNINVGDIIIIEKTLPDNIKKDDVITFEKNGEYITHRVKEVKVQDENTKYITKGDNNNIEDVEEVDFFEIKGKIIFRIPYIGLIILKISKQKNLIIILIIFVLLYRIASKKDNRHKERAKKKRVEDEKIFKDN